ncbi:MAG: T9SS type A sorting domain-containing protein [Flavobacteriaceae bacterium]
MKKFYLLLITILMTSLSYGQVFITELADPNNDPTARYIELYNAGASPVVFTEGSGWRIDKYTNASATVSQTLALTGTIPAGGFYIIATGATSTVIFDHWGVTPDQWDGAANNVAGSNGDDNLELYDGTNTLVDQFGVPGEDGNATPTCHEFEDGRAERILSVTTGNPTWDEAEWNVWTDGPASTCTSQTVAPQDAPGNFDPRAWGTPTCDLSLTGNTTLCDAFTAGVDTYTASVTFVGGGTSTYNVTTTSGSIGGDSPTSMASGTIIITGIAEGTDITVNVENGGLCNLDSNVTSPTCIPGLTLPHSDDFSYADGSLIGNSAWANFSGTSGDLLVASGQAVVQHGVPSEDALLPFTPVAGNIYYGIDFSVASGGVITGGDYEYFAMFKDSGFGFGGRLDVVEGLSGGDFTVGISSTTSAAQATWGVDLTFGVTYRAVVRFDQDAGVAQLWIDASAEGDTSISGTVDGAIAIESFALRQSDSSNNETVTVDNLKITQSFNETLAVTRNDIEGFAIYPNPVNSGEFSIRSMSNLDMSVQIYDMLGKQVYNRQVQTNERINVSNLNSGIYILKVEEEGKTATRKLIIE